MSDFIAQAARFAAVNLGDDNNTPWLADVNRAGLDRWSSLAFPTRKTEDWKYTPLKSLENENYFTFAEPQSNDENHELMTLCQIPDLDGLSLVFVNGYFCAELSSTSISTALPGLTITTFSKADHAQKKSITEHLNTIAPQEKHEFAALNTSCLSEGVFIRVAKNQRIAQPIHIVSVTTAQASAFMVNQRALIVLESGSQATVVEHFASSLEKQTSFVNSVSEIIVGDNAHLQHYRIHEEDESALHIGGTHVELGKSANIDSFHLALGSEIKRNDIVVHHKGEGAHCELNGVYLPRKKQHVDFHTCIEHAVPHCTTNEVFRGIIADSARAVFNGRIHIHKYAQKTFAQLSNKNLLTSNKAEIDTKPELEIYADDVQCAHGATVAQLDTESLHYFKTRGIGTEEAMVMLSFGFINELINNVKNEAVGDYLRPKLAELFAKAPELARPAS